MKVTISDFKKNGEQDTSIEIEPYDTYNLDLTLALIILPCLKEYKEIAGERIDLAYSGLDKDLDTMIKAFELIIEDNCSYDEETNKVISKGLKLFALKFKSLWW